MTTGTKEMIQIIVFGALKYLNGAVELWKNWPMARMLSDGDC